MKLEGNASSAPKIHSDNSDHGDKTNNAVKSKEDPVERHAEIKSNDKPSEAFSLKAGIDRASILKTRLYSVTKSQTDTPSAEKSAAAANKIAVENGLDPLISKETAEKGDLETIKKEVTEPIKTYYDQEIEKTRQDASMSPAAKRLVIRELRDERDSRISDARSQIDSAYKSAKAEAAKDPNATPASINQTAINAAAKTWNEQARSKALDKAAQEYENIHVTDQNGKSVSFTVPYNWNVGQEAGGWNIGKASAAEIQAHVQGLINGDQKEIDSQLNYEPDAKKFNNDLKQLQNNLKSADSNQSGQLIAEFCRQHKIGVDCSGFAFNVRDRADKLLGGNGIEDTINPVPERVNDKPRNYAGTDQINGRKYSDNVGFDDLQAGDTIRFSTPGTDDGHHIAIITKVTDNGDGTKLIEVSNSNERIGLKEEGDTGEPYGVRSGLFILSKDGKLTRVEKTVDGKIQEVKNPSKDGSAKDDMIPTNNDISFWRLKNENVGNENFV